MRRPLIAGNWKMNGDPELAGSLINACKQAVRDHESVDLAVFPPYTLLPLVATEAGGGRVRVGAQDLSPHQKGAYTGEVSASMIKATGATMVLIGHSERRQLFGETDAQVVAKCVAAQEQGIEPVLCVGETLQEREAGQAETVVARQLKAVLDVCAPENLVVAYEPVWAIGTGQTATPLQAQQMHAFIREQVAARSTEVADSIRILYGGSVNAENAAQLFAERDIDGGLVGGASLKPTEFITICKSVSG